MGRILLQRVVDPVVVVVAHVFPDQPPKMLLVQRDDMVEDLAAATSHPAFRDSILPGRLDARSLGFQTRCVQECDDFTVELRVAVEDGVTIRGSLGKSLTQLLDNPRRSWMACDVEVKDLAPSMIDDEEAVEQLERDCWHGEEVERRSPRDGSGERPASVCQGHPDDEFAEDSGPHFVPRRRSRASEVLHGSWGLPSLGSLPPGVGSDRGFHW